MIYAPTIERAQAANQLIEAATCLCDGVFSSDVNDLFVKPADKSEVNRFIEDYFGLPEKLAPLTLCRGQYDNLIYCKVAAKASFRRKFTIALHKFFISSVLHSNHSVDLKPSEPNIAPSMFESDYLRYAYSILVSYSIVEELGLGVKASEKNPSHINGEWNPAVREDLETRLSTAGIDISQPILWSIRGGRTTLERKRKLKIKNKAKWAYGSVRDCEVNIIDAINDTNWVRSKIAAHNILENYKSARNLSVYDVNNAQNLAQRLILGSMGFCK